MQSPFTMKMDKSRISRTLLGLLCTLTEGCGNGAMRTRSSLSGRYQKRLMGCKCCRILINHSFITMQVLVDVRSIGSPTALFPTEYSSHPGRVTRKLGRNL